MTTTTAPVTKYRIESIDILRGLVMLIMAVDHIRDFFHAGHPEPTDLAVTTPLLFLTRLITHFCAPAFVFLSGISAYIAGTRRTQNQLSFFLIKRGLWLIMVEVVFITFAITLNPFYNVLILQVIWAIGGSMILLGLLVWARASLTVIGILGAIIFFGHNIFDYERIDFINKTFVGKLLVSGYGFGDFWPPGSTRGFLVAYALLPWAGVMMLGYVFGSLYKSTADAGRRRKILLNTGLSMLAFFFIFRYFNIYGDPAPWSVQKTIPFSIISFLDVTKYPCSLLYLCLTIGVSLVILALTEKVKNKITATLIIYGNVPFFYYVCHWYLVRIFTVIVFYAQGFNSSQIVNTKQPLLFLPDGMGFSLFGVYLIWFSVIIILYFPCRWYSKYKKTHQQWWLSYL
ncbi:MAG TPA: heparan-alpha-glucosaminide N-acetyltransferase domain-containing protein [Mucilaginibacter sp.]